MWTTNDDKKFGDSVKWFFGGDEKALGFVQANYKKSSQYSQGVDVDEKDLDPQTGMKEIFEMMKAGNYSADPKEDPKMAPNDVHYQFTDFIIRTALFHREIDPPKNVPKMKGGGVPEANAFLDKIEDVPPMQIVQGELSPVEFLGKNRATMYEIITAMLFLALPERTARYFNVQTSNYEQMTSREFAQKFSTTFDFKDDNAKVAQALIAHMKNLASYAGTDYNVRWVANKRIKDDFVRDLGRALSSPADRAGRAAMERGRAETVLADVPALFAPAAAPTPSVVVRPVAEAPTSAASNLYNEVFAKWENIGEQAQLFYKANLHVIDTATQQQISEYPPLFSGLRLNLPKNFQGETTIFADSLPILPKRAVRSLWYTGDDGTKVEITNDKLKLTTFQDIYNCVYYQLLGLKCAFPNLPTKLLPLVDNNKWRFYTSAVVKNIFDAECQGAVAPNEPGTFDVFVDMPTQTRWLRDGETKKLFKSGPDGKPIPCDQVDDKNCFGSLNKIGNKQDCNDFIANCLTGDPKNLGPCLERFKTSNMFEVSRQELENMHPSVAKKILRTFGVEKTRQPKYNAYYQKQIVEPMSFEEWERDILGQPAKIPATIRESIEKTPGLKNYIRGVISFVRSNPTILNENLTVPAGTLVQNGTVDIPAGTFLGDLKKKYYRNPLANTLQGLSYASRYLVADAKAFAVQPSTINLLGPSANGIMTTAGGMGGGSRGSYINMSGGGVFPGSATCMGSVEQKLLNLFTDLSRNGLIIKPADQEKLQKQIGNLVDAERKINEFIKTLRIIVEMQKFVKAVGPTKTDCEGRNFVPTAKGTIALDRVMSYKSLLEWLNRNAGAYESSIYQNINYLNEGTADILESYNSLVNSLLIKDGKPEDYDKI